MFVFILWKTELSDELVSAAENLAKKGLSPETLARLNDVINRVKTATQNLINASTMTTPQEILENAAAIDRDIKQMKVDAQYPKKNASKITKGATNIVNKVNSFSFLSHVFQNDKKKMEKILKILK